MINTYVYLEISIFQGDARAAMERLFIRNQEDRSELKKISDYAKKHKERMLPLAHAHLLYLDVLVGRPMHPPDWEAEFKNRQE